jgi:hypothetical protein
MVISTKPTTLLTFLCLAFANATFRVVDGNVNEDTGATSSFSETTPLRSEAVVNNQEERKLYWELKEEHPCDEKDQEHWMDGGRHLKSHSFVSSFTAADQGYIGIEPLPRVDTAYGEHVVAGDDDDDVSGKSGDYGKKGGDDDDGVSGKGGDYGKKGGDDDDGASGKGGGYGKKGGDDDDDSTSSGKGGYDYEEKEGDDDDDCGGDDDDDDDDHPGYAGSFVRNVITPRCTLHPEDNPCVVGCGHPQIANPCKCSFQDICCRKLS